MEGFIVKAIAGEEYLTKEGDGFARNASAHAFVLAHLFEVEAEAEEVAAQFGGRVLLHD